MIEPEPAPPGSSLDGIISYTFENARLIDMTRAEGLCGVAPGVRVRDVVDGVSDGSSGSWFCAGSRMARGRSEG